MIGAKSSTGKRDSILRGECTSQTERQASSYLYGDMWREMKIEATDFTDATVRFILVQGGVENPSDPLSVSIEYPSF